MEAKGRSPWLAEHDRALLEKVGAMSETDPSNPSFDELMEEPSLARDSFRCEHGVVLTHICPICAGLAELLKLKQVYGGVGVNVDTLGEVWGTWQAGGSRYLIAPGPK